MRCASLLEVVIIFVWAISGEVDVVVGNETSKVQSTTEALQPSSLVHIKDSTSHTATDTVQSRHTELTREAHTLTKSQDMYSKSTTAESTTTPASSSHTALDSAILPSSAFLTKIEHLPTSVGSTISFSTKSALIPENEKVNATQLSQGTDASFPSTVLVESKFYSMAFTNHHSQGETTLFSLTSELESWSTLLESHSTLTESYSKLPWSQSTVLVDHSSEHVSQVQPSQEVQPTPTVTVESSSLSRSETVFNSSTTIPILATSTSPIPSQTPGQSEASGKRIKSDSLEMTESAKIAIAVIVTFLVLGVVVAGIVVYRRYNITHRSLKSFLTSGVRYKTYKNATYKDDEVVGEVGIVNELT